MTITVVQSKTINGAWAGSFNADVTPGSTVFLWPYCYGGNAMASGSPEFNGSAVGTASALLSGQSTGSQAVYSAIWMLPDLAGGAAAVSLANTGNGTVDGNVGLAMLEVSGLGAAPAIDTGASPNPETGNAGTGAVTSGATGTITSVPQLALGTAIAYGQNVTGPASPWSNVNPSGGTVAGWQAAAATGTFDYSAGSAGTAGWFAGVVIVKPAAGGTNISAQLAAALAAAAPALSGSEAVHGALAASLAPAAVAARGLVKQDASGTLAAAAAPLAFRGGRRRARGGMLLFTGGL